MAYKVYFRENGPFTLVDTLAEVSELMGMHGPKTEAVSRSEKPPKNIFPITAPEAVPAFFLSINENAKKLLAALARHEKGMRGDQLAEETGIAVEKMGGIFGGASKIAKKNSLDFTSFVVSTMRVKGSERFRFLQPGKLLIENQARLKPEKGPTLLSSLG